MIFNKFSPQTLRFAIEKELQGMEMPNVKAASVIALNNLKQDPEYYMKKHGFFSPLEKAKYIRKIPDGKGRFKYIYKESQKREKKEEKPKDQTQTPEFKKWFGDSKVVDDKGKPLVVYHGTNKDFKEFDINNKSAYFTNNEKYAKSYGDNLISSFLKIENPFNIDWDIDSGPNNDEYYMNKERFKELIDIIDEGVANDLNFDDFDEEEEKEPWEYINTNEFRDALKKNGYDGFFADEKRNQIFGVVFPNQIKSAIGNRGTFDPNSNDMTKAKDDTQPANGTIKPSTREGKKAMVFMDGTWFHFGDAKMKHNYSDEAREAATARHEKNLEGNDSRAKAFRVYWKKYWSEGGSVKKTDERTDADMQKAKDTSKLVKKVITNRRGKQQTVYVRVMDEPKKDSWINKFASLFGMKDRKQVMQKIESDYKNNQIAEKYSLTWDGWKDHLSEYFKHKDKWDKFFNKSKPEKTGKKEAEKKEKAEKKEATKKPVTVKLSVMKLIHGLYGNAQPEIKAVTPPEKVEENRAEEVKDNFETMPESEDEKKKTQTIDTGNGSKIQTNVKLSKEEKEAEAENEDIAAREGYYNEKPAGILNVGKDVFGAARHNFATYEKLDADIDSMEKDGTAQAYVTKKHLFGNYGLANKDERVANGETEYKVLASFAVKEFLLKIPRDTSESRKKYIEFVRSVVRLDQNTTTAVDFLRGLAENFEFTFPQTKENLNRVQYGADFILYDNGERFSSNDTIGGSLKAFFNTINYPGYKRDYYALDKKGRKEFENLSNILLSEAGSTKNIKSYEDLKIDILGATKAAGIKIKKGDTVLLSDSIKNKVYVTKTTFLDRDGYELWKSEIDQYFRDPEFLPDNGDSFFIEQTMQDAKGNPKTFKDNIKIERIGGDYVTYKTDNGDTGFISSSRFVQKLVEGTIEINNIQDDQKKKNIDDGIKRIKKLYEEEGKYLRRDRIYPESDGQVAKAGTKDIIVSFSYPDRRIRNFKFNPSEVRPEDIESVKKSVDKKETFKPNLFVESKVIREGGKDFSKMSTKEIQKILEDTVQTKSLQYGNSMPDDERKAHTRWVLESFSDLSEILGIPIQQISVNGKLGMAFGARGKSGALAHYEPSTKMINLTRGKGFGSLAHEWGHFLDNILSKDMQTFITRTPEYKEESKSFSEMEHGDVYLFENKRKKDPDRYFYDKNAKNQNYPFAKLAEGQIEPDNNSSYVGFRFMRTNAKVQVRSIKENNINSKAMEIVKKSKEALHKNVENETPLMQKMIKEDKYLNDSAELFARSFECYIADKLEDSGRKNTYLSSKQKTIYGDGALVYPQKELRENINAMFDSFFSDLRTTDDLKKAIFKFNNKYFRRI